MTALTGRWAAAAPYLLSLVRIMAALLFLQHGTQKFFGFPSRAPWGTVEAASLFGVAGILELGGGLLLLLGLFSRTTAFVLSGMMAVAYFMVHAPKSPYPIDNGGELAILYCFCFLYLSAAGPGPWSLDRLRAGETDGVAASRSGAKAA